MMKQTFSYLLAGAIGGLVMLGGVYLMQKPNFSHSANEGFARQANYSLNTSPKTNFNAAFNFTEAAEKATPVVVHIQTKSSQKTSNSRDRERDPLNWFFKDDFFRNPFGGGRPQQGAGSGVIYSSDGYIVTNNHVVEIGDVFEVTLNDNRKFEAKLVGTDKDTDLAILKIEANDLPTLNFADSDQAKIGEWVLAVGNPFDLASTVTAGIISAKGRNINLLGKGAAIESFIQTDAAVNPGNSGGALVDAQGRLIGINTAIATRNGVFSGYSFAIPSNLVKRIVDDLIEHGSFQRAYLGVVIYPLDNDEAEELGVDITQGVVIDELEDGGSAQYAGLQPKDIIVDVNGKEIKGVPELQEIVGSAKVGDVLDVSVYRKGKIIKVPVRLKAGL